MMKQKEKQTQEKTKKQEKAKRQKTEKQKTPKSVNNKKEKSKNTISLFHQLRTKLIISFMVPVCCIVILGFVSYQKAYSAIITSYETSASQTMNMMNQYLTLAIDTIRSTYKSYLNEDEVIKYLKGFFWEKPKIATCIIKLHYSNFKLLHNSSLSRVLLL